MTTIIGHGPLKEYSCKIEINEAKQLDKLIEGLSIPENLLSIVIPVKGTNVIEISDPVNNDDLIHLYIMLAGG